MTETILAARRTARPRDIVVKYGFIVVTVGLFVFFALAEPTFRESTTLFSALRHISVTAILGHGVTTTMVAGGMDLSVGSVAGLAVTVAAKTMAVYDQVGAIAIIAVLVVGALAGAVNALLGYNRPTVWGTALGAVLIGVISTGLTVQGLVLLLALVFSFTLSRRRPRVATS